ncbi:MAG TPA: zinc ABC transporter substrate-binding protein [Polyangia bacterium]|jgi:zinc/manganese transport system substrate-binding protein|nr:zinc ABC transporter substrate-binding protein [Polyangia bacterium]
METTMFNFKKAGAFAFFVAAVVTLTPARADAKLKVVATIETLADLARQVGGDRVDVTSMSHGYQDPHFIQAKPSLVLVLNRADAVLLVGLELEVGWLPPLIQQSRNSRIQPGAPGYIDASTAIDVQDVPRIPADQLRAMGDIHPLGNPHYWVPPKNALAVARLLARRFADLDPAGSATYQAALATFERQLAAKERAWSTAAASLKGEKVVTYHKSWSYVAGWLGFIEIGYIEPKPGTPPAADHTARLIGLMRSEGAKLVIHEDFYPSSLAAFVAEKGGARVVSCPSDVGATPDIKTYFDLVDAVIAALRGT